MNQLQLINKSLNKNTFLIKVPEVVYQIIWDMGLQDQSRSKLLKVVQEYISDKYPQYVIADLLDLNAEEANLLTKRTGKFISWGMYVLITEGEYTGDTIQHLLQSSLNKIKNGNEKSNAKETGEAGSKEERPG